jgi:uncharacterized RDD family membrane protein YckC
LARLLAAALDVIVVAILSQFALYFALHMMGWSAQDILGFKPGAELGLAIEAAEKIQMVSFISVASYAVPAILYNVLFEASALGATPGKLALGLIVESKSGALLSLDEAIRRFAVKGSSAFFSLLLVSAATAKGCSASQMIFLLALLGALVSFVSLIDPVFIFFTGGRRALHDLVGGSCVVTSREIGWQSYLFGVIALGGLVVMLVMTGIFWLSAQNPSRF